VRNEERDFETILHPGNKEVKLNLPRFFVKGPLRKKINDT